MSIIAVPRTVLPVAWCMLELFDDAPLGFVAKGRELRAALRERN